VFAVVFLLFILLLLELLLELRIILLLSMKRIQPSLNLFHQHQMIIVELVEPLFRLTVFGEVAEIQVGSGEALGIDEIFGEG
jgi:hypothetical protein